MPERQTKLLEVGVGERRQHVGINGLLTEQRRVIGKAEILKPLRDVHTPTLRQPVPAVNSSREWGLGGNVLPRLPVAAVSFTRLGSRRPQPVWPLKVGGRAPNLGDDVRKRSSLPTGRCLLSGNGLSLERSP